MKEPGRKGSKWKDRNKFRSKRKKKKGREK
jgi:hypothetical protein